MGGDWIELRIIWGKKLNTPQAETKIFLHLKFNMQLQVFGSKRNLNLPLDKENGAEMWPPKQHYYGETVPEETKDGV